MANSFSLQMTDIGSKTLRNLFLNEKKAKLKMALGDQYQPADGKRTKLTNSVLTADAAFRLSENNSLHIEANFSEEIKDFDIHEIGLLVKDDQSAGDTLLGIYSNNTPIAKKTNQASLLLDVIFNLENSELSKVFINENYKPEFIIAQASETDYGTVRFATTHDIHNETPGLALSSSHLNLLLNTYSTQSWNLDRYPNAKLDKLEATFCLSQGLYNPDDQAIIFLVLDNSAAIYKITLCTKNKKIETIRYSAKDKNRIKINDNLLFTPAYNNKTKNWIIKQDNKLNLITLSNSNNLYSYASGKYEWPHKNIFFYNRSIAGINNNKVYLNAENNVIGIKKNPNISEFSLDFNRTNPLIHVIADKIYILETNAENALIEIHSFRKTKDGFDSQSSFIPHSPLKIDSLDNQTFTSCIVKDYIYIFEINSFLKIKKSKNNLFYRYHINAHTWEPFEVLLSQTDLIESGTIFLKCSAFVIKNIIHLFFIQLDAVEGFKCTVIKLTPPA